MSEIRAPFDLLDVVGFMHETERHVSEKATRCLGRHMDGMIGKGSNLEGDAQGLPSRVKRSYGMVEGVVDVDREVEQPTWRQHPSYLRDYSSRALSMVYDIVAQHHVKCIVFEGQVFAKSCDGERLSLPGRKQGGIVVS
ncbi:MAG TPA: hypothetical protein VGR19_02540 [Allosphingosinicella sp.]|nr:hypothetical protein [Allosphingosinicella sp.]